MPKKNKKLTKNIEMIDYELKARNKFPADEFYPVTEQTKQDKKDSVKKIVTSDKQKRSFKKHKIIL